MLLGKAIGNEEGGHWEELGRVMMWVRRKIDEGERGGVEMEGVEEKWIRQPMNVCSEEKRTVFSR
jgi:hypothetical protein